MGDHPSHKLVGITLGFSIAGLGLAAINLLGLFWLAMKIDSLHQTQVGMTEAEVLERLGQPSHSFAPGDDVTQRVPRREITGKVLMFHRGSVVLYIYLDADMKVECVFSEPS